MIFMVGAGGIVHNVKNGIGDIVNAVSVEVRHYNSVNRGTSQNGGRFLSEGSVTVSFKKDDVLLCIIGQGYIQEAVVIEVAHRDTSHITRRVKGRSFECSIAVTKDDHETAISAACVLKVGAS